MGLQLYRDPDEVDAENAAAAKLERSAAQGRSPIRREPSIRPGREYSASNGLPNIIRYRHEMRQARIRSEREIEDPDAQIVALETELQRLRQMRVARGRAQPRNTTRENRARFNRHFEDALNELSGNTVSNDVFLADTPDEPVSPELHASENVILPRPARESNLRFELGANPGPGRPAAPSVQGSSMLSPPRSLTEITRNRPVDGPLPDTWETTPPLSHDFAPARAARATLAAGSPRGGAYSGLSSGDHHGLETPPPEAYEGSSRLRRVPHLSPQLLPRATVDGLGDRHRSPSESLEGLEEDSWNHLLSTMDTRPLPATRSMTDSFSASRSDSQPSTTTSTTQTSTTSFGEIGLTAEDTCDLPPGITEDDVRPLRERHRRDAGRVRAPRRYARHTDEYDETSNSALSILLREARESRLRAQRGREELIMTQAIAERQQNREQIPDEWWTLAGIPPLLENPPSNP